MHNGNSKIVHNEKLKIDQIALFIYNASVGLLHAPQLRCLSCSAYGGAQMWPRPILISHLFYPRLARKTRKVIWALFSAACRNTARCTPPL